MSFAAERMYLQQELEEKGEPLMGTAERPWITGTACPLAARAEAEAMGAIPRKRPWWLIWHRD